MEQENKAFASDTLRFCEVFKLMQHVCPSACSLDYIPLVPPVSLKAIRDLTMPKTSTVSRVCTFPVLASGRNNSKIFPLETTISCILVPTEAKTSFFQHPACELKKSLTHTHTHIWWNTCNLLKNASDNPPQTLWLTDINSDTWVNRGPPDPQMEVLSHPPQRSLRKCVRLKRWGNGKTD